MEQDGCARDGADADRKYLHRGQAQHKVIDAMFALKDVGKLKPEEKARLIAWSRGFDNPEERTLKRLDWFAK